ncbi:MAG: TlpA family protein disulfide reductase [Actinomycetia bacterium]|nr:TlpA family protein disulfide reductase [Actinomycetes bacterium]MCP4084413.1 TlpA family protein disulfide reductase [Actinomycetes bacterium]
MSIDTPDEPSGEMTSDPTAAGRGAISAKVVLLTIAILAAIVVAGSILWPDDGTDEAATAGNGGLGNALANRRDIGDPVTAEDFEMFDGSTATFADFEGKPLVVNFFASWCGPCRAEMPDFQAVHEDMGEDVTFIGFAFQDREEDARALIDKTGVTYALATDPGQFQASFGGIALPTTAFVDENGRIIDVHSGPLDQDGLKESIAEHLGVTP